jgi:PEP-CTERM motif
MLRRRLLLAALAAPLLLGPAIASATIYNFTVEEANQNGVGFSADPVATGFNAAGAIAARFQYSGPLSFSSTSAQNSTSAGDLNSAFFGSYSSGISNYSGTGALAAPANASFATLASFLASSGSASGFRYGSLFTIDLGILPAGTRITVTHDDGASIWQGSTRVGSMVAGPTSKVTDSVTLTTTADTTLYYARENGTPSILEVTYNGGSRNPPLVPEPTSLALFATGLATLFVVTRRRRIRA